MTSYDYSRPIATASRMLAKYGAKVTWKKRAGDDPNAQPWKDGQTVGDPPTFNPYMAFFSVEDAGRGGTRGFFMAFMKGTDIPDANEIGFLAGDCGFVPEMSDTLTRSDGTIAQITGIDKIAPGDTVVMWFVTVK